MRSLFKIFFITAILVLLNCSNDDDSAKVNAVEGEWKLEKIETYFTEENIFDYTNANIIYNFQSDKKLIVSGGENLGYSNGEYVYDFIRDYLTDFPAENEQKIDLVIIEQSRWVYTQISSNEMSISTAYVDGPTLFFVRSN